jgi:hypothetical protein
VYTQDRVREKINDVNHQVEGEVKPELRLVFHLYKRIRATAEENAIKRIKRRRKWGTRRTPHLKTKLARQR